MKLLAIILFVLIIVYIIRISNNNDIIKKHIKTEEDKAFIKKTKKEQHKTKLSLALFGISIVVLIICLICDYTTIDYILLDYFSTEFIKEPEFNKLFYFTTPYILIINLIYTQVNIGDKILNYFKTQEEELAIELGAAKEIVMGILYKKKPTTEDTDIEEIEILDTDIQEETTKPEN